MARNVIVNCDICLKPDAMGYTIGRDSEQWLIDLCEEHAAPILAIAKQGQHSTSASSARGGSSVRTLESRIRGLPEEADRG